LVFRPSTFVRGASLALFAFTIALDPIPAGAADGFALCDAAGDQDAPSLALANDFATWVAWRDFRRSDATVRSDVYVARVPLILSGPGTIESASLPPLELAADGIVACASGTAEPPVAVATDSGGVLVVWSDTRTARGIYMQRLRADLTLYPGWPADGRLVTSDVDDDAMLAACSDGAGGVYLARKRAPAVPDTERAVLTRVTKVASFAAGWSAAGVPLGTDTFVQGLTVATDPSGGAVFTARFFSEGGDTDLQYATGGRVAPGGSLGPAVDLPGWRSGGQYPGIVGSLAVADGAGGLVAAWNDAPGPEFYGGHWSAAGTGQWPDSLPAPHMDVLVADGAAGAYLVGREKQDLNLLSVQRRTTTGAVSTGWEPGGRLLADPLALAHVTAVAYAPGGVLVAWSENKGMGAGFDIRAAQVRANGRLGEGWVAGGNAICDVPGNQTNVVMTAGSTLAVWVDTRNNPTTQKDLYAAYVLTTGGVGVTPNPVPRTALAIRSLFPNPARDELRVSLDLAGDAPLEVVLVDVRGRVVLRRTIRGEEGRATVVLYTRGLPAGVYGVRAAQGAATAHARATVLR
jgi:hypothetical protein